MEVALSAADCQVLALAEALRSRGGRLATAESCTGGLIAAACTALPGSSEWFECGFVTYSNAAKTEMLGVAQQLIVTFGAVSAEVAAAMAEGALARSQASLAVACTGIAGPGGATQGKPVGTVWLAIAAAGMPTRTALLRLDGSRTAIRERTVSEAIDRLTAAVLQD